MNHYGEWHINLETQLLSWSERQYEVYGYRPRDISLDIEFFIFKTTHFTEVDRIKNLIATALESSSEYNFRRRTIKANGRIGFVETQAAIYRRDDGSAYEIAGITMDLGGKGTQGVMHYNDPLFFDALYNNYRVSITRIIVSFINDFDIANDICQEVFIKAWNNIHQYNPERGGIYTWLTCIAKNQSRDFIKSKYYKSSKLTFSIEDEHEKNNGIATIDLSDIEFKSLLRELPSDLREITELLFFKGYKQEEVALIRNIPLGTVKTKSRKAIGILRKQYL